MAKATAKEKFSTQVDPVLLAKIKAIAQAEGRLLQSLVEEALFDLLEKRSKTLPSSEVLALQELSVSRYGSLYERLAK